MSEQELSKRINNDPKLSRIAKTCLSCNKTVDHAAQHMYDILRSAGIVSYSVFAIKCAMQEL